MRRALNWEGKFRGVRVRGDGTTYGRAPGELTPRIFASGRLWWRDACGKKC